MRGGKLAGWFALVGSLAALNYASRFSSGKPPADSLYRHATAISGLLFYAITLGIVLVIARGMSRSELGLRRPASWPRALGFTLVILVALLIAETLLESLLHGAKEQGLEPAHWDPSRALPFALNAAVVVIAAPIVEELTFRGVGFRLRTGSLYPGMMLHATFNAFALAVAVAR